MAKRPLLLFPEHITSSYQPKKMGFGFGNYHYPDFKKLKDRLTPQFESMLRCDISSATTGLQPESVLVIETIGEIDDFQRAVRAIKGLEWLGEIDEEEIKSDEEYFQVCKIGKRLFYNNIESITTTQSSDLWKKLEKNGFIDENGYVLHKGIEKFGEFIPKELAKFKDKILNTIKSEILKTAKNLLSGRLYLSMSNQNARNDLLILWKEWDTAKKQLPRGYAKWKEIFEHIKSIRPWDINDRLRDTGIIEYLKEELEIKKGTASLIPFEIELWYRNDSNKQKLIQQSIEKYISDEGGKILATCTINEIRFHAIKAELPPECVENVINSVYTKVFKSNDVMFFRPVGQFITEIYSEGVKGDFKSGSVSGKPIAAILDGVPFANHTLLENRLILEDPDDYENTYTSPVQMRHGTAMASLVCHGELDALEKPLPRPVYFRPIMKPDPDDFIHNPPWETCPKDIFIEDIIERSVQRMFAGEGSEKAAAPSVKIINLSIGDPSKMFFNRVSSIGRLLDWLSEKYQILFCVSAGNITSDIDLRKDKNEISKLTDKELTKLTLKEIHKDIRNRRIFSPADSINAITVGAVHNDMSTIVNMGNRVDIMPNLQLPSPYSAHGHGFRNSIKPEIYFFGGRQLYDYNNKKYAISDSGEPPGQKVATTPVVSGETTRTVYTRGTSNATALATRGAAQIYEVLNMLNNENAHAIQDKNVACILKALLVHSASWGNSCTVFEACLKNEDNSSNFKKVISRHIGFGIPNINRVIECTEHRATAIGYGKIKKDQQHDFRFPLPPSLSGRNDMRKLTITLAWFSPVNAGNRRYRKANLSIEPPKDAIGVERKEADWHQVKNGTVQHEVLEGKGVVSYNDGEDLKISVVCREDAESLDEEVYYGLVVTLETVEGIGIPIYEEIKERITVPIPVEEHI